MHRAVRGVAAALAGVLAVAAFPDGRASAQDDELPPGPGKAEVADACTQCHMAGIITAQRRTPNEWSEIMTRMVGLGASLSGQQKLVIAAYLNATLGKPEAAAGPPR